MEPEKVKVILAVLALYAMELAYVEVVRVKVAGHVVIAAALAYFSIAV
jgi:hypothetical protein